MRRFFIPLSGAIVVALGVIGYFFVLPALAAGPSLNGNWKITFFQPSGQEMSVWILQIETKDGARVAKVLSAIRDELRHAKVVKMEETDKALRFTMHVEQGGDTVEVPVIMLFPEKEANPNVLRGTMTLSAQRLFAQMERTDLKDLDNDSASDDSAVPLMMKAVRTRDAKAQEKLYAEVIQTNADKPLAYFGGIGLLNALIKQGKGLDDLRKPAEAALAVAAAHGAEMKQIATAEIASVLSSGAQSAPLAVEYARQAEKNLTDGDAPEVKVAILKTLVNALRKSGKADEAKQFQPRIDKLEETLDAEYLKVAVPFKPKIFGGRAGNENRVVLMELFTGAHCLPCIAADVAFDGLLQTYKPSDVVFLQYHLHAPSPDPLTNADGEARSRYYDVAGTPTSFLNGQPGPEVHGGKQEARPGYARLFKEIGDELKTETKAAIQLKAQRKGDIITIAAGVSGLETTGEKVRLRLALVEEVVRYQGLNGQRLHHNVVRGFPGGVDGVKLLKSASQHEQIVQIKELAKSLSDYLTASNEKRPFMGVERPMELNHLKVVAFIQNDDDKKVLQAVQADVEEKK